jgi:hypothetical protein
MVYIVTTGLRELWNISADALLPPSVLTDKRTTSMVYKLVTKKFQLADPLPSACK